MIRQFLTAAVLLAAMSLAPAQNLANSPLQITKIEIEPNALTPEYNIGNGPQRKARSQTWLWVEVSFTYSAAPPAPQVLPELTFNYYILLNNASRTNPTGTLLTGTVTHTGVTSDKETHHSVMLVSPQTLRGLFDGKPPSNISSAAVAIGVTASINGQLVAEQSIGKGKGTRQWWQNFQQGPAGLVLTKDQTPFAPLFYDYFEAVKAKGL